MLNIMNEDQSLEANEEPANEKNKNFCFEAILGITFWIVVICFGSKWFINYTHEKSFLTTMYDYAVDEVKEKYNGVSNLKIEKYKKEYVAWQTMEYHDFGAGELRYFKYAVKVPIAYDDTFGHYEQNITIIVYYYTSEQNVSSGVDETVENHFYVQDMYENLYDIFQ